MTPVSIPVDRVEAEIKALNGVRFASLLEKWKKEPIDRILPPLLVLATSQRLSSPRRFVAIQLVARLAGPDALPELAPIVNDPSPVARFAVALAYRVSRDPRHVPDLLPLLSDKEPLVREVAVDTIGRIRSLASLEGLMRVVLDDQNYANGKALALVDHAIKAITLIAPQGWRPSYPTNLKVPISPSMREKREALAAALESRKD